ncbi:MAG: hypothetical protein DRN81_06070 [Thermoproteota archaeon]|nr:MAG: hypothetical protein DRN81_06070 [Candidatus Korarchaeota archaeon]
MRVRRTGAKRGQSPIWYVMASTIDERRVIDAGLLKDVSPSRSYCYVLNWGYSSKADATAAMHFLQADVDAAIAQHRVTHQQATEVQQ